MNDTEVGVRLARLEARAAIIDLVCAYGDTYDGMDFERFGALFTEDASYDITPDPEVIPIPLVGRDAIVAAMRARRARTAQEEVMPRHLATNVVVRELGVATARTTSFIVVLFTRPSIGTEVRRAGFYDDVLRDDGDGWRFASRHLHLDP